jgi:hypothetical protein
MKPKFIQVISIILLGVLMATSCKKDEPPAPTNQLTYDNNESIIGPAFAQNLGELYTRDSYGYYVYFLENTFTVHFEDSLPDSLSGTGNYLLLAMVSSDSTGLKPGIYYYNSSHTAYNPFSFGYESLFAVNYDPLSEGDPDVMQITGGKVDVSKSGSDFEFIISLTTTTHKTITGFYKGSFTTYPIRTGKKSEGKNPFTFPMPNNSQ